MSSLTPKQRKLARHALGLPNRRRRSYRNYFLAPYAPNTDADHWFKMVEAGHAESARPMAGKVRFWLTHSGACAALDDGEILCTEDFPKPTSLSAASQSDAPVGQRALPMEGR